MQKILKWAHRGASGYEPENTIAAFEKAIQMGADGIELDVHLSADGEVIVIHDETFDRTTNGKGSIANMSLQDIKSLRIDNKHEIPTLTEVLDLINRRCLVNIEIKGAEMALLIKNIISSYINNKNWSYADFLVSSFDWVSIAEIQKLDSNIHIAVLTETDYELALSFAKFIQADAINPNYKLLTKEMTTKIQKSGIKVYPWAVNEQAEIDKLKSFGVNGIITDFPDRV